MLTHSNVLANAFQFNARLNEIARDSEKSTVLGILPFAHSFGLMCAVFCPIFQGHKIIIHSKFNPIDVWKTVEIEKITEIYAVPTMYIGLLRVNVKDFDISSLKLCVSGGSALPNEINGQFFETTGVKIIEGYGLTECSPVTHLNPLCRIKAGSIGIPLPDTEVKIIDPETLKEVEIGQIGELVIKGPQVMKGYFKRAKETERVFIKEEILCTGDLAKKDEEGYFYIVDRLKDVINSGGLKIYPREVEEIIYKPPKNSAARSIPGRHPAQLLYLLG